MKTKTKVKAGSNKLFVKARQRPVLPTWVEGGVTADDDWEVPNV
jgi:hypothetical protein